MLLLISLSTIWPQTVLSDLWTVLPDLWTAFFDLCTVFCNLWSAGKLASPVSERKAVMSRRAQRRRWPATVTTTTAAACCSSPWSLAASSLRQTSTIWWTTRTPGTSTGSPRHLSHNQRSFFLNTETDVYSLVLNHIISPTPLPKYMYFPLRTPPPPRHFC